MTDPTIRPQIPVPKPKEYSKEIAGDISHRTGLTLTVSKILAGRGFFPDETLDEFLNPRLGNLLKPATIQDFQKSIERIVAAVAAGEVIGVFGDYDMDGIGSAAMWSLFFRRIDTPFHTIIAQRNSGYGLDPDSIEAFRQNKVSLILACDVGSTDYESAALAKSLDMEVIIIDHHHIDAPFPEAFAIINPQRGDCDFPYLGMATVGLTFYVIAGLRTLLLTDGYRSEEVLPDVRDYLDIVALGTLADVAPLTGVNRIMVSYGISLIRERSRESIRALLDLAKLQDVSSITEKSLVFKIVPKLNAPGRMGDPQLALDLLLCPTYPEALEIGKELRSINSHRQ
ncbi:DHH family phosphoesterase, partial [Myxococcota bacterium]|nr:DHH family phosphoesterase [Myxococcota bacterium]MBU1537553.1 DHH family phosphoesterase [Myxococcota bacterium]